MDIPAWLRIASVLAGWIRRLAPVSRGTLVVLPGGLGDVLLFSGVLRALRQHDAVHPLIVACRENTVLLLEQENVADAVIPICPDAAVGGVAGRVRRIWNGVRILRHRYHKVLHPVFTTVAQGHQVCAVADGEHKVWFDRGEASADEVMAFDPRAIYTQLVEVGKSAHELDKAVEFLRAIGVTEVRSRDDIRPQFHLTEKERKKACDLVAGAPRASSAALCLAVCVGARFKQKDWGVEQFAELIRRLAAQRPIVAFVLGDGSDRGRCAEIKARVEEENGRKKAQEGEREHRTSNIEHRTSKEQGTRDQERRTPILPYSHTPTLISLAGQLTVRESAAVIAECDLCVGNDTFGLHAAIAVGTPSVVIMGGGNFGRWTPWGDPKRHRMVNAPMDCYGCGWKCIHPDYRCIHSITVDQVGEEIRAVLG